ncbi:VWA domain-containing protein [candidate division WOR-3 bacterium]|nr:VWA domain-containing protein [candidate division WOR-3 bacterium]
MKKMISLTLIALAVMSCKNPQIAGGRTVRVENPTIEVVFVLDATGSMSGLIEGAKQKIWSIANEILSGDPVPDVKIGLVVYRDRGDEFVVKKYDITDDIDQIYIDLTAVRADGGGDFPEDVNQALSWAVDSMSWTDSDNVLKLIFLVGDAPPHMDYNDVKDYKTVCKEAIARDIIINTVRCGSDGNTEAVWQEIANLAEGTYTSMGYNASQVVSTPYDEDIAELSRELYGTVLLYGSAEEVMAADATLGASGEIAYSEPSTAADRATYAYSKSVAGYGFVSRDLVSEIIEGKVQLSDLKEDEIPEIFKEMSMDDRTSYIDSLREHREDVTRRMADLTIMRDQYIKENIGEERDAFDLFVIETLKEQAVKIGVSY